jgi:hypothetical protein
MLAAMGFGAVVLQLGSKFKRPEERRNPFKTAHHLSVENQNKTIGENKK